MMKRDNRYLRDRASRRSSSRRDRGMYRERRMIREPMYDEASRRSSSRRDRTYSPVMDSHYEPREMSFYGEVMRYPEMDYARDGNDYNDYARGRSYRDSDYARSRIRDRDYRYESDYGYESDYSSDNMEEEYEQDLKEWIEKLKKKDKFNMTKDQVIQQAKSMGVKFDEFDELEFYAIYLAKSTDYKDISNDPTIFIKMARDFFEDDDIAVSPSEKVCIYLYKIVLGE